MISQKCPRCHSNRIRRGYRPTRIWSKLLFRYNLLCNACNWQFKGFALPFTVSNKPHRKKKKQTEVEPATETQKPENSAETNIVETYIEEPSEDQTDLSAKAVLSNRIRVRKKVRIRQS